MEGTSAECLSGKHSNSSYYGYWYYKESLPPAVCKYMYSLMAT